MSLEIGQQVEGRIANVRPFGAFVDLPDNQTGMIHISEVSNGFVKDINDHLKIGDDVTAKVIKITDDGKINLSLKGLDTNPNAVQKSTAKVVSQPATKPVNQRTDDFDKMMSQFLKDSEDRLLSLKRSTEGKRGGRGGRRS